MADKHEITAEEYEKMVYAEGDSLVVDLSAVEEMKFEKIPKGIYDAEVDEVTYGKSNSSGAPMFTFSFRIDGGEFEGRKLPYYTSFSPKALSGTKTALSRLDANMFSGVFKPQEVAESGALLQKKLRIKVGEQEYNGEIRSKIDYILAPSTGEASNGGFFSAAA